MSISLGRAVEAHGREAPEEPAALPGSDKHEEARSPVAPLMQRCITEAVGRGAVHLLPHAGAGGATGWEPGLQLGRVLGRQVGGAGWLQSRAGEEHDEVKQR